MPHHKQKLKTTRQYEYWEDPINELRYTGRYAFSLQQVRSQFEQSDDAIKKHHKELKERNCLAKK